MDIPSTIKFHYVTIIFLLFCSGNSVQSEQSCLNGVFSMGCECYIFFIILIVGFTYSVFPKNFIMIQNQKFIQSNLDKRQLGKLENSLSECNYLVPAF